MIEHVAVQLPWLTNELNRVGQPISIEFKTLHGFNQAVLRAKMFAIFDFSSFQLCFRTSQILNFLTGNFEFFDKASEAAGRVFVLS